PWTCVLTMGEHDIAIGHRPGSLPRELAVQTYRRGSYSRPRQGEAIDAHRTHAAAAMGMLDQKRVEFARPRDGDAAQQAYGRAPRRRLAVEALVADDEEIFLGATADESALILERLEECRDLLADLPPQRRPRMLEHRPACALLDAGHDEQRQASRGGIAIIIAARLRAEQRAQPQAARPRRTQRLQHVDTGLDEALAVQV